MKLVKMLTTDDGDKEESPKWHLVWKYGDADRTVCRGVVFGIGESIAQFKTKTTGKITCRQCIDTVKWFKDIKL